MHRRHQREPYETSTEMLEALPRVFKPVGGGAGRNSAPLNDGAGAVLLCSRAWAAARGLTPIAVIGGTARAGVAPRITAVGPVPGTAKLLARLQLTLDDIDQFESTRRSPPRRWRSSTTRV